MTTTPRAQLADDMLRCFAASLRSAQLYSKSHPIIVRNLAALSATVERFHGLEPTIVIGIVGEDIIVDDTPISRNAVSLNTGELAVAVRIHAPDPHRPQVHVIVDRMGGRLDVPYDVNLWECQLEEGRPSAIAAPIDPADLGIDPLTLV